ncbi:hypothetical protein C4J65_16775 [Streptomyces sp. CB09001]|nr:hypothetical protein C4J65_16775 [Streptomyces sp. CB09001]
MAEQSRTVTTDAVSRETGGRPLRLGDMSLSLSTVILPENRLGSGVVPGPDRTRERVSTSRPSPANSAAGVWSGVML